MNCKKCGTLLPENVNFCTSCGEKVEQNATQAATPAVEIKPLEGEGQPVIENQETPAQLTSQVEPVVSPTQQEQPAAPVEPAVTPVQQEQPAQPTPQVGYGASPTQQQPTGYGASPTQQQPTGYGVQASSQRASTTQPTNKKNSTIIFIAIALVLVIIIGVLVYMLVVKDDSAKAPAKTTTTTKEIEETKKTTSTTQPTTTKQVAVTDNNQVDMFGLLTVNVPEKFTAELEPESELLAFYDKATGGKTEAIALTAYEEGFYEMLFDNREMVKQKIEARNGTNARISFGQTEDFNSITISYTINGTNVAEVILSKPDFDYDLYFVGIGASTLTSDDIRTDIVDIVFNIKLNTTSNFAGTDIKYKNKPVEYELPNMSLNQE